MTDQPEKLVLSSMNITEEKKQELLRLFPEVRTEGGQIDFERLKLALGEMVDVGKERYGMNWPGKAECFRTIQAPSTGTLLPCPEESVNFNTTENLIIEGDNLEVLKLLQKAYLGKVKMIYIDPPYNTGNDFIYPDNYTESLQTYLEYTGQVDNQGRKFGTNTDTDGRFHSRWMNMMYPRLYLARNLLRDDGVILVSIDDHETDNLKLLLNEIYGEENFIITITWEKGRKNDSTFFSETVEYIHVFAKNKEILSKQGVWRERKPGLEKILSKYEELKKIHGNDHEVIEENIRKYYSGLDASEPERKLSHFWRSDNRGLYFGADISSASTSIPDYEVIHPITKKPVKKPSRGWGCTEGVMLQRIAEDRVLFGVDESTIPLKKSYLLEVDSIVKTPVIYKDGRAASLTLRNLFGKDVFDNPKDHLVLLELINYICTQNSLVLDFFAGSGSTAHAILDLNKEEEKNLKYILVQLPEPLDPENKDDKSAYDFCELHNLPHNIAEITKERVRRVITKLNTTETGQLPLNSFQDRGFRVFKLSNSNFQPWEAQLPHNTTALVRQLELHIDHIREGSNGENILYEILLKSGFSLTTSVERLLLADKLVFSVSNGMLLICLEPELTMEVIRAMAGQKPERVVCLDAGFAGNDQLKSNAVQIFKTQGVPSFKTV